MNKEEILRRSRLENHVQDERDKVISAQSTMVGMIGMTVIFLLLLVIRLLWKDESPCILAIWRWRSFISLHCCGGRCG